MTLRKDLQDEGAMSLEFSFSGLEARRHHISANEGLESLAGLAHAATLVAHYVATRKIRQRTPYDNRLQFFFGETRPGSLTAILSLGGALALGAAGNATYDVLKAAWKRATGTGDDGDLNTDAGPFPAGDLDALAEAITPSLLRGHAWIDHPDQRISIKTGRQILTDLNEVTKQYLKDEIVEEGDSNQDVSIAALNVNSRHGRAFFFDLGRTIPFKVSREAHPRTVANLSRHLTKYAEHSNVRVSIRFKKVLHLDGRLKRIIISDCEPVSDLA